MRHKLNDIFVFLVSSTTIVTLIVNPTFANSRPAQCVSPMTNTPGNIRYTGDCIPRPLWINPNYGSNYARFMRVAIKSAVNKYDYDTAIINFYRAQEISGYRDPEVRRGLLGAVMAKAIKKTPVPGYSHPRIWLLITGEYYDER
ncbi:hypothetical protein [Mastigocoleus testarum]|uniref:hypothetical protein n=1 Tax=Mastigocoleus testarum TaxID=996925 RepID=UPI001379D8F9|nr:hypothetical protein [Mastigocoleus testarum]